MGGRGRAGDGKASRVTGGGATAKGHAGCNTHKGQTPPAPAAAAAGLTPHPCIRALHPPPTPHPQHPPAGVVDQHPPRQRRVVLPVSGKVSGAGVCLLTLTHHGAIQVADLRGAGRQAVDEEGAVEGWKPVRGGGQGGEAPAVPTGATSRHQGLLPHTSTPTHTCDQGRLPAKPTHAAPGRRPHQHHGRLCGHGEGAQLAPQQLVAARVQAAVGAV